MYVNNDFCQMKTAKDSWLKLAKYKFIILFELKTRKFLKRTCCLGRGIYRSQRNFFLFQGYGIEYERPIGSSVGLSSLAVINDNLVILGAEDKGGAMDGKVLMANQILVISEKKMLMRSGIIDDEAIIDDIFPYLNTFPTMPA